MKTKSAIAFLTYSLLLLLSPTVLAAPCPPPDCGDCYTWNSETEECEWDCTTGQCCDDGVCVDNCDDCYTCESGSCEWDCTTGQCCDDGTCVSTCPSGQCCSDGTCVSSCPSDKCCSSGTCVSWCPSGGCCDSGTCVDDCPSGICCFGTCCGDGQECCGIKCCSNACCGYPGTCCDDPMDTCCGSQCCVSDCCSESHSCCGRTGRICCDGTDCYDPATEQCCGDGNGTVCDIDEVCCDGMCCPEGQHCCDGGCADTCWTKTWEDGEIDGCSCTASLCSGYHVERDGRYVCAPAGTGVSGWCECIKKKIVIQKHYECDANWDEDKMAECAFKAVVCQYSCNPWLPSYDPASCADCLSMGNYDCCGGDGWCTPCDFVDCEQGVLTEEHDGWVFDRFEGDSCGSN